jgi:hypothetical protein
MRGRYSRSLGVGANCVAALWRVKSLPRQRGDRPKLKFDWLCRRVAILMYPYRAPHFKSIRKLRKGMHPAPTHNHCSSERDNKTPKPRVMNCAPPQHELQLGRYGSFFPCRRSIATRPITE